MEQPKPKQAIKISWELFSRMMVLRGKLAISGNKVNLYELVEAAIEAYLKEMETNEQIRTNTSINNCFS